MEKNIFNQNHFFECIENFYLIENELKLSLEKYDKLKKSLTQKGDLEPIFKELKGLLI